MSPLERITVDQTVRFGKPCVRGTRITVGDVLSYLAAGTTEAAAALLRHHEPALRLFAAQDEATSLALG